MAAHEAFDLKTRDDLLEKARALGIEIPYMDDVSPLLTPVRVAGRTLANRLAVLPMEAADGDVDGSPTPITARRYERLAAGGASLIWFEATAVTPESRSNPHQLMLNPSTKAAFKRLLGRVRKAARAAGREPLLILQLTHSGRFSKPEGIPQPVLTHRNPFLDGLLSLPGNYPLIDDGGLQAVQDGYLAAAGIAQDVGFDGVDVKACHGYLVSELLASFTRRDSRYGGSLANRSRFLLETLVRIGNESPGLVLTGRLSVYDSIPSPFGFGVDADDPAREDLTEPVAVIRRLLESKVSLLSFSAGIPAYKPWFGRPFDKPVPGGATPDEHPLEGVGRLLRIAGLLQCEFPDLPVVGTGMSWLRGFFPHVAAAAIAEGMMSLAGLGRGSLARPDWPEALSRDRALAADRACTTCSLCSKHLREGKPVRCLVHDNRLPAAPAARATGRGTRKV
jgi:2,4-dienoyl-CoA reductase-like NADH-dependent reductase (Old Yellow Enzyme family)